MARSTCIHGSTELAAVAWKPAIASVRTQTLFAVRTYRSTVRSRGEGERPLRGFVPGSPDIAVEVVSPSNTAAEMERKVAEYLAAGSQRVWVAHPSIRSVTVHRADGATITYTGDDAITDEELLPGFSLPLSEIFD